MNKRQLIKKVAKSTPIINELVKDRDRLYIVVDEQKKQIAELKETHNKLEKSLINAKNPINSMAHRFAANPNFQISERDIMVSKKSSQKIVGSIKTANWFIPNFKHISYGGLYTIFRFIEKMSTEGVENRIILYGQNGFDEEAIDNQISTNFKQLKNYRIILYDSTTNNINALPESDIAVCTLWDSAYLLLHFNKTKQKFYFIQDYEPLFYPAGTVSALAESTYRFGFKGIVNTNNLLKILNQRFGINGISFDPGIDENYFQAKQMKAKKGGKIRIFFYARPDKPRNGFELGIETIKQVIKHHGDSVEIVAAGSGWDEGQYGLKGQIINHGLLNGVKEVAKLYGKCDIGLAFMFTKHPSYQPLEFMATGVATVVNRNEDNLWLLHNKKNCLISEPSPAAMAEAVGILINQPELRKNISQNGLNYVKKFTWNQKIDELWAQLNDIKK